MVVEESLLMSILKNWSRKYGEKEVALDDVGDTVFERIGIFLSTIVAVSRDMGVVSCAAVFCRKSTFTHAIIYVHG